MLFNSLEYIIFLSIMLLIFYAVPKKIKNYVLLIGSIIFYWKFSLKQTVLLFIVVGLTYVAGIIIENEEKIYLRKIYLFASLIINIGFIIYFKYFNFLLLTGTNFINSIKGQNTFTFTYLDIILPVGISFYIFQALGYVIDVYRKDINVEKNIFKYTLFVSFFPPIASGPIGRASHMFKEFEQEYVFEASNLLRGLIMIIWGLFKKMVIADRIAILVNTVYSDVANYKGIPLLVATVGFAIQLYCDFSGYSDIAVGSAQMFGINLIKNFDAPYLSLSVSEFWKRWHISLSSWFRDYLYIPLGGNKKGIIRKYFNIVIVFLISGLWHGAAMNYIVWGLLNGLYQVVGESTLGLRNKIMNLFNIDRESVVHKMFRMATTFFLICISYIFFRGNTLSESIYVLKNILYPNVWILSDGSLLELGLNSKDFILLFISVFILMLVDINYKKIDIRGLILKQPLIYRWAIYIFIIVSVLVFGVYGTSQGSENFLYFQF